jgi:glycosyltransferase involved in cell wall biosynthesis
VLQVTDGYRPAVGGMERVVETLSKELVLQGVPTTVATLSRPDAPPYEEADGVVVRRLDGFTRHLRRFATDPGHFFHPTCPDPQLVRRIHELVTEIRPDIVHAHGWILNSCLSLPLPPETSLVCTLHDYGLGCAKKTLIPSGAIDEACAGPSVRRCLSCAGQSYGRLKGTPLVLGLRESRRRLDRVSLFLPISSAVASASLKDVSPERICEVPSFVEDSVFAEARETGPPDFLPPGDFVLFVGALGEHKGVSLLAEAHRRMRNSIPLVMIGSAQADTPELAGAPSRPVIVRTGVPHNQIMASLAAAAVAVSPSRWQEPFGLVAIEAMAAGTPAVVTRVGALPEIIAHQQTGLVVKPGDASALADALDQMVENPHLARLYGQAALQRARRFTASATVPRVIAAYEKTLAARLAAAE